MVRPLMKTTLTRGMTLGALVAFALLSLTACNKEKSLSGTGGACKDGSLPSDKVVATWNGGKVTAGEVDKELKAQIDEASQKLFQARKQGAEQIAIDKILDA